MTSQPTLKPLGLRRNFSWTFIGNGVYAACQWGILIVFAKLGSPEMVGQFTIGLAVTAPIMLLAELQLRVVQATDAKRQYQFADYLGLRILTNSIALLIIGGIVFWGHFQPHTAIIIGLIGVAKMCESCSDVFHGLLQQHERMDRIAKSLLLKGILSLSAVSLSIYLTHNVVIAVISLVIAWLSVFLIYDIPNGALILGHRSPHAPRQRLHPRWHLPTLGKLIWLCLPLGFGMMMISLNANIPRYFIEWKLGERELGIFAALSYLMVAVGMIIEALAESATPRFAKYYAAANHRAFQGLLIKVIGIGIGLGLGAVGLAAIGGKTVLTLLYRPEYAQYSQLFIWLMVAAAINNVASFLGHAMTAARFFRIQMPLFVLTTAVSGLSCFWLIPKLGLQGAAIALILSSSTQVIISLGVISYALQKLKQPLQLSAEQHH